MPLRAVLSRVSLNALLILAATATAPAPAAATSQPVCDWATGMLCIVAPASISVGKVASFEVSVTNTTTAPISGSAEGEWLVVKGNKWDWQYDMLPISGLATGSTLTGTMRWKITEACDPCQFPFWVNIDGSSLKPEVAITVPLD
jgi:hypothetical protein